MPRPIESVAVGGMRIFTVPPPPPPRAVKCYILSYGTVRAIRGGPQNLHCIKVYVLALAKLHVRLLHLECGQRNMYQYNRLSYVLVPYNLI